MIICCSENFFSSQWIYQSAAGLFRTAARHSHNKQHFLIALIKLQIFAGWKKGSIPTRWWVCQFSESGHHRAQISLDEQARGELSLIESYFDCSVWSSSSSLCGSFISIFHERGNDVRVAAAAIHWRFSLNVHVKFDVDRENCRREKETFSSQ